MKNISQIIIHVLKDMNILLVLVLRLMSNSMKCLVLRSWSYGGENTVCALDIHVNV